MQNVELTRKWTFPTLVARGHLDVPLLPDKPKEALKDNLQAVSLSLQLICVGLAAKLPFQPRRHITQIQVSIMCPLVCVRTNIATWLYQRSNVRIALFRVDVNVK